MQKTSELKNIHHQAYWPTAWHQIICTSTINLFPDLITMI